MSLYQHLDDYRNTIHTPIARPVLVTTDGEAARLVGGEGPPAVARWPPERAPLSFWGSASVFAQHCGWLESRVPGDYLTAYWGRQGALPGLAHLHVLYDRQYHRTDDTTAGPVDLDTAFCLCDCPMLVAPPTVVAGGPDGAVRLLSRCMREAFRWNGAFSLDDLRRRVPEGTVDRPRELLLVVACCRWPVAAWPELEGAARDATRHPEWLPTVLESVSGAACCVHTQHTVPRAGIAVDYDGLLLQVALLLSAASPLHPPNHLTPKLASVSLDSDCPHLWATIADACSE
jgi:hypothetical protein